jgi:hypothetical protein
LKKSLKGDKEECNMGATAILLTATGVGFGVLIYEKAADILDLDHLETVRKVRKIYLKLGYPVIVVAVGVTVFVKLVHILI